MGIFTRFRDIINSNINTMLDKAEDPEKLIQHMIYEMEDTLVDLKATCAGVIAESKDIQRRRDRLFTKLNHWDKRARLAVERGRDDLAREALKEKQHLSRVAEAMEREVVEHKAIVDRYREDITLLEEKLVSAREKQRILVHRHIRARHSLRAKEEIQRMDSFETMARFDDIEERIERMEAEAELVGIYRNPSLEDEFQDLIIEEQLEKELEALKAARMDRTETVA